jgi:hypothetical protein
MSFVIVEGAACATLVENDGVIWYHVVRPFSPGLEKTKRAAHLAGCAALSSFIWNSFRSCIHAPACRWLADVKHGCLLYVLCDFYPLKRDS